MPFVPVKAAAVLRKRWGLVGAEKTFPDFLPNFPPGSTSGTTDWASPEENLNKGEKYWERNLV